MLPAGMDKQDKHEHGDAESHGVTATERSTEDSTNDQPRHGRAGLVLTILHHPDGRRVGERISTGTLAEGVPNELSRVTPGFRSRIDGRVRPLAHSRLSRAPVWLRLTNDAVSIVPSRKDLKVRVDHRAIAHRYDVPLTSVRERGVVIALGGCVLLFLSQSTGDDSKPAATDALLGVSPAIDALARAVARVAPLPAPILLRGEPGVGTESVARAIHRLSDRADGPWVSVDMAAVPGPLAATELFGDGRPDLLENSGERVALGCFARAHEGTVFVNDIGRLSAELQTRVLWTIKRGQVHAEGKQSQRTDVRLIATAADDLQKLVATGRMIPALAHRLQEFILDVPPLRARRVDIPLLLHTFLRTALMEFDAASVLHESDKQSRKREWLRLNLITRLMRYSFPGNVAELRNVASQMATYYHDQPHARLPPFIDERLDERTTSTSVDEGATDTLPASSSPSGPSSSSSSSAAGRRGKPSGRAGLSAEVVRATLRQNRWNIRRTALALGISKNTLTRRIRTLPDVRLAGDLGREEILQAQRAHGTDAETLADALEVSMHGLQLRIRELGLD